MIQGKLNMGIGDWGLGIGDWGWGTIPNPQSPIPNPQSPIFLVLFNFQSIILIINSQSIFKINKMKWLLKKNYNRD